MLIKNAKLANNTAVDILISGTTIQSVQSANAISPSGHDTVIDATGLTALPAFIDLHCHFRTPGFEHKEDLQSGSLAAARGGYTLVTCMANTNPVCSTPEIAKSVMDKAEQIGICSVNQCVSITKDFDGTSTQHIENLPPYIKCISDDGKGVQSNYTMWQAMIAAEKKGLTLMSHAEDMDISPYDYRLAENIETVRNLHIAQHTGAKLHMCHVSTKEALAAIIAAKGTSSNITCEVAPHHIWFYDNDYRVNPPIRAKDDVDYIINAIKSGAVDAIATDHAPHTQEDKENGSPGMVGLETAFGVCYTKLCVQNSVPLQILSDMLSKNPAKILGENKGEIAEGFDADIVLLNLDKTYTVDINDFAGKSKNSPFNGEKLQGQIINTIKNGKLTYSNNN